MDLKFNAPQFKAYEALEPGNTIFLGFGRGVGKSWLLRQLCWLLVGAYDGKLRQNALLPFRGVRMTALAPTLTQWKDIHWSAIEEELGPHGRWARLGAKFDRSRAQVTFKGGSSLRPFPASEYNARTARGMRTDVLVADELDDIPTSVYEAVAIPWLSEPWSLGIQILAGTPTRGRHGLWYRSLSAGRTGDKVRAGESVGRDEADVEAFRSVYSFHATYRDAPETVSAKAVAKAKATTDPATFKREWEADPDAGEGLVYPFVESFHVRQPPDPRSFREFIVGGDWGWTDAGVLLRGGVQGHGEDATLWLLDEWYEREVPNHIWDQRAAAWRDAKFWPDPSRPDRINDLRAMGLNVGETDNDIYAGVARVANLLFPRPVENGAPWCRLYVSPKCVNTIREFGLYRRKKLPDGTFDEQPADKDNHTMDALRYMVVGRFGRMPNVRHVTSGR